MALGLYLPTRKEIAVIDLEKSAWGLIKRGGYIAAAEHDTHRSLRKNSIYFFSEGSAFHSAEPLKGKIVNLRPQNFMDNTLHPIWRCGMPLFINL
jgi:CRISPR/Cas system CSM-associated protein Csm4 (group 5 of RAMP superfamily)